MSSELQQAKNFVMRHLQNQSQAGLRAKLLPKSGPPARVFPGGVVHDAKRVAQRWAALEMDPGVQAALLDPDTQARLDSFGGHIENFVGTTKVPVGIVGPLRVNGLFAQGDFVIPLATTESALVASFHRGACLLTEVGGCAAMLISEGVTRTPGFAFGSIGEAGQFVLWAMDQLEAFRAAAQSTTRHGQLADLRLSIEGNHVYLHFSFVTGGAAGQNMVTIATDAICRYILEHTPVPPDYWFLEANLSGDKKASTISFTTVRGRKVTAEARLPGELVNRRLHTTPARMEQFWRMSAIGAVMGGTIGIQGHYANGLAALYLACGQDVACVAESAVGVTRMELTSDGRLYASVTLPNIIVGTVGGGTSLPSQQAGLKLLGLTRGEDAPALTEVCGALALAGEISIIGALSAQEFARAHARLARGARIPRSKNSAAK